MSKRKPGIDYIMLAEFLGYYRRECYALFSSNGVRGHPDQYGDAVVWRSDRDENKTGNVYDILAKFNADLREKKESERVKLVYYVLSPISGQFVACSSRGPSGPPEKHGDAVVWLGDPGATWKDCQTEARRLREMGKPKKEEAKTWPGKRSNAFPKHGGYPSVVGGKRLPKLPKDLSTAPGGQRPVATQKKGDT
jgi:hypothetical protein